MPVEQREQVTHITGSQRATGGTPGFDGRRQPSLGGTSRMNREIHVRICEGLGVRFPGPTRRAEQSASLPRPKLETVDSQGTPTASRAFLYSDEGAGNR